MTDKGHRFWTITFILFRRFALTASDFIAVHRASAKNKSDDTDSQAMHKLFLVPLPVLDRRNGDSPSLFWLGFAISKPKVARLLDCAL